MRSWFWLFLSLVFVGGCRQEQPKGFDKGNELVVQPEPPPRPIQREPEPTAEEIKKRIQDESIDVFLVLPNKPEFAVINIHDEVVAELKKSLDELPPLKLETTGGGWFLQLTAAPVKDVEEFGTKQGLGRVLAYDSAKRRLLVEYKATPSSREAWKDAVFLDRQIMARSARWGAIPPSGYPSEQVVYVRFRGDWSKDELTVQGKLKTLLDGPEDKRGVWMNRDISTGAWVAAIAPVTDLEALTKRIDFAEVIYYDTEHRALILGH